MFAFLRNRKPGSKISYQWGDDCLLIELGNNIQPRIKILFWAEFMVTIGMATVFLFKSIPFSSDVLNWAGGAGAAALYLMSGYRFLSRMLYEECLFLDADSITIIERTPFAQKHNRYLWREIGPLHYIGKEEKTDHPLKGRCYDYFGFETREQLIQSLHQEGNLFFNHNGLAIRFAKGVYSWHAEEMVNMMKLYTGSKLRLGMEWARMLQEHEWGDA
ncbi:MAG: hypothetical protein K0R82_579 [Flavipsychrobacter sp.]|jgi:hypothetical protein|nr:hypothetical protein [Flavipsychrobacter sp.]